MNRFKYKISEQEKNLRIKDLSPEYVKRIEDLYGPTDPRDFFSKDMSTYFKYKETESDAEGGGVTHAVIKLASVEESLRKMEETYDALKDLLKSDEAKNDQNIRSVSKDIKMALNKYRAHLRKFYPEQYKQAMGRLNEVNVDVPFPTPIVTKANNQITNVSSFADFILDIWDKISEKEQEGIQNNTFIKQAKSFLEKARGETSVTEDEVDEISTSGAAGSYLTPFAFRKKGSKPPISAYKSLGYKLVKKDKDAIDEGFNDREVKGKLSKIDYDFLTSYFNGKDFFAPNSDDSSRKILDKNDWIDWKQGILNQYGNVEIELDNTAVWYDKVKILSSQFTKDKKDYSKSKGEYLDNLRSKGVNYGLDEIKEGKLGDGADLGPGPKAGPDGVTDNYYIKGFKYKLVPKNKNGTYVQKNSGLEVKKLF